MAQRFRLRQWIVPAQISRLHGPRATGHQRPKDHSRRFRRVSDMAGRLLTGERWFGRDGLSPDSGIAAENAIRPRQQPQVRLGHCKAKRFSGIEMHAKHITLRPAREEQMAPISLGPARAYVACGNSRNEGTLSLRRPRGCVYP